MLFMETAAVYCENHTERIHSVGIMQNFSEYFPGMRFRKILENFDCGLVDYGTVKLPKTLPTSVRTILLSPFSLKMEEQILSRRW
jgi:hypothetical protein